MSDPLLWTRRAALGAMAAAGLGFVAFGPRGDTSVPAGRKVLDYWEKWTGHEGRAMRRIVDDFNRSQGRLFVRYFSMNNIGQKALVAIAGGDPPDIVGLWNFSIPQYAETGALVELDGLAAAHGIRREAYAPQVWPMLTHAGRLWGVVNTVGSVALYYNRALFREARLDPDRPPRTIAELDECNERLTRVDAAGRIERMGFVHTEPGWWVWHWGYFFGGALLSGDGDRATVAAQENVRGFEWVQSYPDRYRAERLKAFQSGLGNYSSAEQAFLSGRVAMATQGPWLANVIREFRPDLDYGAVPFPVHESVYDPERPIGLLDGDVLVIPRGARDPEASFEFIAFTQRPENVEFLSTAHCKSSPLARSSAAFFAGHPNRSVREHDRIAQSPRAFYFPRTRVWRQWEDAMNAGFQRIWAGDERAGAVLSRLDAQAQSLLDRAEATRRLRRPA